jgi:alpha-ketoglutarate-dependent 2,4-dichlorophenoxyacetate dioxygenase
LAGGWRIGPRLSPAGGVRVCGVDLSQPLSTALKSAILALFREHQFLVFPQQRLTREAHYAFSANFGESEERAGKRLRVAHRIGNLDAAGRPSARHAGGGTYLWHTDKSYYRAPALLTTLYAVELPPAGGDTELANTALGYRTLPQETQRAIEGLRVLFRWNPGRPLTEAEAPARPPVDHPLVRTHPDTGSRALYLGNHASHILGMPEAEGRALLAALLAHTTQPQFVYAHRWQTGDLVIWDNRCLLHRAVANFDMTRHRRILHRTVIRGTVPS